MLVFKPLRDNICMQYMSNIFFEVLVALCWRPLLAETCKGSILLLKKLLKLLEFDRNFTCMFYIEDRYNYYSRGYLNEK
jgi:hypothetical protein